MTRTTSLAPLLERFFTQRLMQQRQASPHTISSYRDTFRQFLIFAQQRLARAPSRLSFEQIDAPLITAFLDELETRRALLSVRSRNLRLTAIHSFFRYAAFELPTHAAQIQRVLAIPSKRFTRKLVSFLSRPQVDALLAAPDRSTWSGRRDHAFILTAVQTGLRLSEMTGLKREDFVSGGGAHLRVVGKGRKERCTPLAKPTRAVLKAWLREPPRGVNDVLFPSARGERLTVHGVQYLLNKHRVTASTRCPSLKRQRVTVHRLRHTAAMDLLQAGVDRAVIALWLGHEAVETTQIYLEATLAMKEQALAKIGEQRLEHGVPPSGRHTTMFISNYVVNSTSIIAPTRPSGRLRHIVEFATYGTRLLERWPCCSTVHTVHDSRRGEGKGAAQAREAVPCHAAPPASPAEPFAPQPFHFESESVQRLEVAGDAVVGVVTSQLAAQRRLLVAQFPVPMIPAPLANSPQRSAESVLGGLAFDDPSPLPGASPIVSEPQHREAALSL